MGFYDEIAKGIKWEYTHNVDGFLKVKNGVLQLPQPGWLQWHLRYLDNVIEAINAFRAGQLKGADFDIDRIEKTVIKSPEEALRFLREVLKGGKYHLFSIDIESSNLLTDKAKNKLLCIGIGYEAEKGVSFMRTCFKNEQFRQEFQEFVRSDAYRFILHNGIFDRSRAKIIEDLELKIDEDTLLMHYCGINEHKGTHGLKELAQLYLGFPDWEKPLDDWKKQYCKDMKCKLKDFQYSYFPQDLLAKYCCVDVCATYQLYFVFDKLMRDSSRMIYHKLVEASSNYADMISRGMLLDKEYWKKLRDELEARSEELQDKLFDLAPGVKISSPKQLLMWLQQEFPYDYVESSDKDTIENLLLKYPDHEALNTILEFRKNQKYLKTYVYGLWERMDSDGIIHCEFKLHGTETGRLSSANPNMQNIPRNSSIKSLFISRPGYLLLQLDYSQAELRTLAYISGDEKLIECYREGRDLHGEMQKQLFGDKFDPHDKEQRNIAKTINFGIPYGRTAHGMARKLRLSMPDARRYLANWFAGAPRVKDFIEKCHEMALKDPQDVYYTVFGRARHYYVTPDSINHVKNQSVNFPISSTANDLTIFSLCEICKYIKEQGLDAYPINTVHDSIIIEVHPKDVKQLAEKCQEIMATVPQKYLPNLTLPFKADAEIGTCYGDLAEPDWGDEEEEEDE